MVTDLRTFKYASQALASPNKANEYNERRDAKHYLHDLIRGL